MKGRRVVWPSRAMVEIEEFGFSPLGDNELLVATECSLISPGTERAFLLGLPNAQGDYPSYPGYSNIGVIIDRGSDVSGFDIGDRVVSSKGHTSHFVATPDSVLKVAEAGLASEEGVFATPDLTYVPLRCREFGKLRLSLGRRPSRWEAA